MSTIAIAKRSTIGKSLELGIFAGLGGGVVFGMMMAMMNMLPMVAALVGSKSPYVGGVVHMAISATIGAIFGVALNLSRFQLNWGLAVISGLVNGVIWWVLGGLILMPLGLGMPGEVFQIGNAQWLSFMGHMIYGVVTGLVFVALSRK